MVMELHLLQNFAPSCLNRDDTNAPKDCEFGGVRRARISSQCLKRAIRWHPEFLRCADGVGSVRTRRLLDKLCHDLQQRGHDPATLGRVVPPLVQEVVGKLSDGRLRVLVHLGEDEIERLERLIVEHWGELQKASRGALDRLCRRLASELQIGTAAPDIALFGRMVAENAQFDVDAACQVAHAISTHRVAMELDFFSAIDDLKPSRHAGSEMIGSVEFNSSCFYRYAAICVDQLVANLNGDASLAEATLAGFMRATVAAVPAGKQNAMAAANPPSFIMAVVRSRGMNWSLVNAFEKPVAVGPYDGSSLVGKSVMALDDYWGRLAEMYSEDGVEARPACWLDDCPVRHVAQQRVQRVDEVVDQALAATRLGAHSVGARSGRGRR